MYDQKGDRGVIGRSEKSEYFERLDLGMLNRMEWLMSHVTLLFEKTTL